MNTELSEFVLMDANNWLELYKGLHGLNRNPTSAEIDAYIDGYRTSIATMYHYFGQPSMAAFMANDVETLLCEFFDNVREQ